LLLVQSAHLIEAHPEIFGYHGELAMGKRKQGNQGGGKSKKKSKVLGIIDPNTSGVYATCNRGKEQQCRKELLNLLSEKMEEYFDLSKVEDDPEEEGRREGDEKEDVSIEDQIAKELAEMKETKVSKKAMLLPIELGCECLVFIKTRKPIDPEILVENICSESYETKVKTTRYTQKLTPVTFSVSPSVDEIKKLAKLVLAPHFHQKTDQKPLKFAIQVAKRNFNVLPKHEIIQTIAECVGREHGHQVDLKQYDKLIMVECYKSNIGMSVVNNYLKFNKFNLQQIYENNMKDSGNSRVHSSLNGQTEKTDENRKKQKNENSK
jgi:tRNA acetyltransferase TAN1